MRMALELDAEKIPNLALVPVRGSPEMSDGRKLGRAFGEGNFDAYELASLQ
jgi:hypothetical protein